MQFKYTVNPFCGVPLEDKEWFGTIDRLFNFRSLIFTWANFSEDYLKWFLGFINRKFKFKSSFFYCCWTRTEKSKIILNMVTSILIWILSQNIASNLISKYLSIIMYIILKIQLNFNHYRQINEACAIAQYFSNKASSLLYKRNYYVP